MENLPEAFEITRSRPHGHVAAVVGTLKNIGLHNTIAPESSRNRNLVLAMIVARILDPASKLATARGLDPATSIATEAALDGLSVIRTDVSRDTLDATSTVKAYKSLSSVEQAFRRYKTVDLKVRPIFHHLSDRVKAHVFLCMLAYYVEWHMRQLLAPILFDDDSKTLPESASVVAPAVRSDAAIAKAQTKRTLDGFPVHSFQTLLTDLGTLTNNRIQSTLGSTRMSFDKITTPTPLQQKAFDWLGVSVFCTQ